MAIGDREVAFDGNLFRAELEDVGREFRYEQLSRIPATMVMPITTIGGEPHVVEIHNDRVCYGKTVGLPGGNAEGGFDNPEPPKQTGLRELRQETGYGYPEDTNPNIDVFELPPINTAFRWARTFMVARGVVEIGGKEASPAETIEVCPVPLEDFMGTVLDLDRRDLFQETTLAFARASMQTAVGSKGLLDWLAYGSDSPYAEAVVESLGCWMAPVDQAQASENF